MDVGDLLKSIAIDAWYKALLVLGAIAFFMSLFWDVKGVTNGQLQLLAGGAFLLGLGEWKNHKVLSVMKPANAYTGPAGILSTKVRAADFVGVLLDVIGVVLIVLAAVRIWKG